MTWEDDYTAIHGIHPTDDTAYHLRASTYTMTDYEKELLRCNVAITDLVKDRDWWRRAAWFIGGISLFGFLGGWVK